MQVLMTAFGTALLLALGPTWATPLFLSLPLLPRAQALGPVGFPFLGLWGGLTIGVLAAQVAAFVARAAWMTAVALRQR